MSTLLVLVIIAAFVGIPALIDLIRRGDLRRMAVRNTVRRPFETALIIIGSALGTAIIVAALMVGDTFEASILDIVRRNLGEVDLVIEVEGGTDAELLASAVEANPPDSVDGVLILRGIGVAAAAGSQQDPIAVEPDRPVEPAISVNAVDFERFESFGSDPDEWSLVGLDDPGLDGVVINDELAEDLEIDAGDVVTFFAIGTEIELEVSAVVDTVGLGGWSDAYVSNSLFDQLGVPDDLTFDAVAVSLEGTLFDSTGAIVDEATESITTLVEASDDGDRIIESSPADGLLIDPIKQVLVDDAAEEDEELTTLFFVVGGFSVFAGALLLINLFVMLSEERKPNLGVLRAIGWNRRTLRRAFRTEGLIYAVPASVGGSILGIGVGWVIVQLTRSILQGQNPDGSFQLLTTIQLESLLIAGLSGFVIAMLAIWFTSWRISRLNIVTAIRDLPSPVTSRGTALRAVGAASAIVIGVISFVVGQPEGNPYLTLISVPLIVVGLSLLLRSKVSPLLLSAIGGFAVIVWGLLIFEVLPDDSNVEVQFFLAYGIVVVAAGVALATVSGTLFQRIVARSSSGGVAARLALAYPTARVFRTASSLGMYSLIIFSLAFMAVLAEGISSQSDEIVTQSAVGHDLLIQSLNANPLDPGEVEALGDVESASAVFRTFTEWSSNFRPDTADDPRGSILSAADESFIRDNAPILSARDSRFGSDREAFEFVIDNRDAVVAPLTLFGSSDEFEPSIGDTVVAVETGAEFEIVGLYDNDFTFPGIWVNAEALLEINPEARATRLYVSVVEGADADVVGEEIEAGFIQNGVRAESFEARVNRFLEADLAFFSLLRGYLLLGLVIGIGGLAVTLSRAVRERRRQIGMLRSMGLNASGVGRWFLGEAAFISIMGIVCGAGLGVLSSYFLATRAGAVDGDQTPFAIPWVTLLALMLIPLVASAIAAIAPARRAAALRPSEALRLAA